MHAIMTCMCLCVLASPHPLMASCHPHSSRQTQQLWQVLLLALCDSHQRLRDITHAHLDLMWQWLSMACTLLPTSHQPNIATRPWLDSNGAVPLCGTLELPGRVCRCQGQTSAWLCPCTWVSPGLCVRSVGCFVGRRGDMTQGCRCHGVRADAEKQTPHSCELWPTSSLATACSWLEGGHGAGDRGFADLGQ